MFSVPSTAAAKPDIPGYGGRRSAGPAKAIALGRRGRGTCVPDGSLLLFLLRPGAIASCPERSRLHAIERRPLLHRHANAAPRGLSVVRDAARRRGAVVLGVVGLRGSALCSDAAAGLLAAHGRAVAGASGRLPISTAAVGLLAAVAHVAGVVGTVGRAWPPLLHARHRLFAASDDPSNGNQRRATAGHITTAAAAVWRAGHHATAAAAAGGTAHAGW